MRMKNHRLSRTGLAVLTVGLLGCEGGIKTVGDDTDTSPFRARGGQGISTAVYIRHMAALIRYVRPS